jgi:hypothetical protein
MSLHIVLNIVSINLKNGELYYIDDNGPPYIKYESSITDAQFELIKKYTNIDPSWVECYLLKVEDVECVTIHYFCIIPDKIKIKQGTWVKINDYEFIHEIQKFI